ncbi:DUF285 domain-containing protein, partial [Enterococcus faecalis]|nr:DUF285 domain-containing protein [Enterococcus faecalis]
MKVSTYMLVSSFVLGSFAQPVSVLAEAQKESISSNQSQLDKRVADALHTQVEKLPLKTEEKRAPLSNSDGESEDPSTTSAEESNTVTSEPEMQDSSEMIPKQEKPQVSTFTWGGVPVTFAKEEGTLAIAGGEFKYRSNTIYDLCKSNGINPLDVKKIHLLANLTMVDSMERIFSDLQELTEFEGLANLNVSKVTSMSQLFSGCSSLTSLDLSSFDTSKVTTMFGMFNGCSSLTNLDVSSFNTSEVTDMDKMFNGCSSLTNLDVSSFNTSEVTDMDRMFSGCSSLTNLDVSSFNTSEVTDMDRMFSGCSSLTNLDLSNFDTSKVTTMEGMLFYCFDLKELTLGGKFKMEKDMKLPSITPTQKYTGKWQNIGEGFKESPAGTNIWTSQEFMEKYSVGKDADTYVWQPIVEAGDVTVKYEDEAGKEIHEAQTLSG